MTTPPPLGEAAPGGPRVFLLVNALGTLALVVLLASYVLDVPDVLRTVCLAVLVTDVAFSLWTVTRAGRATGS